MTPKELFLEAMRRQDSGDHEGFLAMQTEDCEWVVPGAELHGRDAVREWTRPFDEAFSSSRHECASVEAIGETVYSEGIWRGVNDGPLPTPQGEVPATGREVALRFAVVVRGDLERGQARSVHLYFDQLEFLGQLGLIPETAAA
jgi:hypothetical protein